MKCYEHLLVFHRCTHKLLLALHKCKRQILLDWLLAKIILASSLTFQIPADAGLISTLPELSSTYSRGGMFIDKHSSAILG